MLDALAPWQRALRRPPASAVLRDEGQLEPRGAADFRTRRLRLRHRLGRRAASACWPPAATRRKMVFSGVGKTRDEMRRALEVGVQVLQRRKRGRAARAVGTWRAQLAARAGQPARQPRRRCQDAPLHLHRAARQQVRHRPRARRWPRTARAAQLPGLRGGRHRLPHRLADHRGRARTSTRSNACSTWSRPSRRDGIAHAPRRSRRRPRHHLHRRGAADAPTRWSRACWSASTRAAMASANCCSSPGRSLVGNAGVLLTRCCTSSTATRKNFCIVDAAMNDLVRPAMYRRLDGASCRARCATRAPHDLRRGRPGLRVGRLARPRRSLAVRPGDLLAVLSAGAYGMAMASNYNSRPRAAEVMVDGEAVHVDPRARIRSPS